MENKNNHLPLFGIGPLYVVSILITTAVALILNYLGLLNLLRFEELKIPFLIVGILLIAFGVFLWVFTVCFSKIDKNIVENKLVVNGIYSYTRNPIYTAFLFINTGVILLTYNLLLLFLPILYYIFLTLLLINTEEKWLEDKFGQEYLDYKKKVNRVFLWPKKK